MITAIAMVSKSWYDKLPPDLQRLLMEEGEAVQKELFDWTVEANNKARALWTEKGGELIKLPAADQAEFTKRVATVGDEVVKSQPAIRPVYELLVESARANR